jgi:hypothetical protein
MGKTGTIDLFKGGTMKADVVWRLSCLIVVMCLSVSIVFAGIPAGYQGTPFHNDSVKVYPIRIPGKMQCEYYDFGGKDVAFGGTKLKVNGINVGTAFNKSQGCNEGGTPYLCTFRDSEDVAISYTKPCCDVDTRKNMVTQTLKQMYTGWTPPGEWMNYTVHVDSAGIYSINFMYTAPLPLGLEFSLALNNQTVVNKATVVNSCHGDQSDALRWHRWNKMINLAEIAFPDTGLQLITFTVTYPNPAERNDMGNFDYIEFVPKSQSSVVPDTTSFKTDSILHYCYPNPFNNQILIGYKLSREAAVTVGIYDSLGQKIKDMEVNTIHPMGEYQVSWNGTDDKNQNVATGIYLYRIHVNDQVYGDKILLLH